MAILWVCLPRKVVREEGADTHRAVDPSFLRCSRQLDSFVNVQAVREDDILRSRIYTELSVETDGNVDELERVAGVLPQTIPVSRQIGICLEVIEEG